MVGVREIYAQVDAELARLGAVCLGGGACCKFDLFDHRLYVTTAELAVLSLTHPPDLSRALRRRCPYQVGPGCYAYHNRPLGCRTFFCRCQKPDPFQDLYEDRHRKIQDLHEICCIPYAYAEVTASLTQLFA